MKIELKNVKIAAFASHETTCFEATVYIDGRRAGTVSNEGCGGANRYHFPDRDLYARFVRHCKRVTKRKIEPEDALIAGLLDEWEARKIIKGHCRKKTLFQLVDDPEDVCDWRTVNAPYSAAVKEYLTKKYGGRIRRIANEIYS